MKQFGNKVPTGVQKVPTPMTEVEIPIAAQPAHVADAYCTIREDIAPGDGEVVLGEALPSNGRMLVWMFALGDKCARHFMVHGWGYQRGDDKPHLRQWEPPIYGQEVTNGRGGLVLQDTGPVVLQGGDRVGVAIQNRTGRPRKLVVAFQLLVLPREPFDPIMKTQQ